MTEPKSEENQLLFFSASWAVERLLLENMIQPQYIKAVEGMINKWNSLITAPRILRLKEEMRQEIDECFK